MIKKQEQDGGLALTSISTEITVANTKIINKRRDCPERLINSQQSLTRKKAVK